MYRDELELLRSTRSRTLNMVAGLSQQQFDFSPQCGKWSIGEVLDHLLLSEELFRGQIAQLIELDKAGQRPVIKRSLSELDFSVAFIPKSILALAEGPITLFTTFVPASVRFFLIRNRLLPALTATAAIPSKGGRANELTEQLRASLRQTEVLFEENSARNFHKMLSQHPFLGTNNVIELLRLVALHEQRHHEQISEVIEGTRFPRVA